MKKALLIVLLLFVIVGGLGYLTLSGKLPFLSNLILKQKDLGIEATTDEIYAFYEEIGYEDNLRGETPKSGELIFEGAIDIEHTFTQSEINSWLTSWEQSWTGIPFENLQIKISPDGTVEASSLISVSKAEDIGRSLGYTQEEIDKAKTYLKYIPDPLPLYATGTASIINNEVNLGVGTFKVAGIGLPDTLKSQMAGVIEDVMERAIHFEGAQTDIKSAKVTEAGVEFIGTVPRKVSIKSE